MTEREMMEQIKASAEDVQIPESLSPENMKKRLEEEAKRRDAEQKATGNDRAEKKGKRRIKSPRRTVITRTVAAAAVCLVCGAGVFAGYQAMWDGAGKTQMEAAGSGAQEVALESADTGGNEADEASDSIESGADAAGEEEVVIAPKKDAGELYVVAGTYEEIYDRLDAEVKRQKIQDYREGAKDAIMDIGGVMTGGGGKGAAMEESIEAGAVMESAAADSAASGAVQNTDMVSDKNYSKTNLQTAGVEESDIIKTDGSYLYIVRSNTVEMIDIRGSSMKKAGTISVPLSSGADRVVEMYVDGDKLSLIVEREETSLGQSEGQQAKKAGMSAGESEATAVDYAVNDVYYMNSSYVTEFVTYDITNRKKPVKKGSMTQDGTYKTSRKIGDIVYLFTEKRVELPQLTRGAAVAEENAGGWIPLVNGKAVAADCIYLPENGNQGLLVSSVDVDTPDKVVDNTLILNNYVNIYVSTGALYLYSTDYSNRCTTQIAKFGLNKGQINAVGAASAAGEVYDTFAINEYQGKLRLLTTDWSGSANQNQLYVFDKDLKLTGSLTGMAKGEQIYAARYLGNTAYFVTYRNTDPLFTVDLSDDKNPKILSELKITGFSEYLHFWGKDKLVGIGYETDPDTRERKGIKLTMFDISNPSDLKTAGTLVIGNMDYSPALYDYKCVLADSGENLIGFAGESYGEDWESSYLLFSWENGKFKELLTEKLLTDGIADENMTAEYRGIYVGEIFYLASPDSVTSYDRENSYRVMEKLDL